MQRSWCLSAYLRYYVAFLRHSANANSAVPTLLLSINVNVKICQTQWRNMHDACGRYRIEFAGIWNYFNFVFINTRMTIFHDEIEIEDFDYDEEDEMYYYPCPCGDRFQISKVNTLFNFYHERYSQRNSFHWFYTTCISHFESLILLIRFLIFLQKLS